MSRINIGVGVDIENIHRFRRLDLINDSLLLDKIFTENELDYCFSRISAAPHLAARFSAKEAIYKALQSTCKTNLYFKDIEILNNEQGVPIVCIHNKDFRDLYISLSLSHCEDKAAAFAVVMEINHDEKD